MNLLPADILRILGHFPECKPVIHGKDLIVTCPDTGTAWDLVKNIPRHYGKTPCFVRLRPSALVFGVVGRYPDPLLPASELPTF
jgi:hypothetical protein